MAAAFAKLSIQDQKCDRPRCPGRDAVSFCITCGEKLCTTHKKVSNEFWYNINRVDRWRL